MERNRGGVLTNCSPIECVFAGTGGERFSERDAVLNPAAILHQGANIDIRLPSEGDSQAAIGETADGFLETIWAHLLDRSEHEGMNRRECHCRIPSGPLGVC
jgi:hypothetical protein